MATVISGSELQTQTVKAGYGAGTNLIIGDGIDAAKWGLATGGYNLAFQKNDGTGTYVEQMKIDSAGRVTMPNQPAFGAVRTAGHVSGSNAIVVWNETPYCNVGNHYNTSNGAFTAPVAGTYYFSVWGMFDNGRIAWFELLKNGVEIGFFNPYQEQSSTSYLDWIHVSGSLAIYLNAGDYVQVRTGSSTNISYMYATGSNYHNGFSGFLIG